jgi:ATP-dependent Clp protease ATP-binding subunit ClpC
LTEKLRRSPYSVVLFDEIEKAHPDLYNVLLQVFEDGILTDAQGNTVDCRNAIFIMTSNIGAKFIQKRTTVGFHGSAEASREKMEEQVLAQVKQTFAPEFINRLMRSSSSTSFSEKDLSEIIDLQIVKLNQILSGRSLSVILSPDARKWLIEKTFAERSYGARPLKRALQKYVEDELSEALIQGQVQEDSTVEIFRENDKLAFRAFVADELESAFAEARTK